MQQPSTTDDVGFVRGTNRRGLLILGGVVLLFFWPLVLHPGSTLYSDNSDFLALHLPAAHFQLHAMRETGEVPYWCPWVFGGQPFPPILGPCEFALFSLPKSILPETSLGAALSWGLVGHCFLAAAGMWFYARARGLGMAASLCAAIAYAFAGRTMLHLLAGGHYLPGLAWIPLILLALESALRRRSVSLATVAGILFAILILDCHPQWTFYSGILIGSWSLCPAVQSAGYLGGVGERTRARTLRALACWVGFGGWVGVLGVALSAVFLMPMFAMAPETSRFTGVASEDMFSLGRQTLLTLIGPPLQSTPASAIWEERGAFGMILLILAVLAPFLNAKPSVLYCTGVCVFLFCLALGGALMFQWLPGLKMFRQPSRMLLVAAFPIAYLVGISVQALVAQPGPDPAMRRRLRRVAIVVILVMGLFLGIWIRDMVRAGVSLEFHPYWLTLLLTLPLLFALLSESVLLRSVQGPLWVLLLLTDLWGLCWPYVQVRPEAEIFPVSESVRYLTDVRANGGRVLDRDADGGKLCSPLGRGAPLAMLHELGAVRGYSTLDLLRYKEYLNFIGDQDKPLVALRDDLTFPVLRDLPLENRNLLDLLGVRYLLQPADQPPPGNNWKLCAEDASPRAYDFVGNGMERLPAYRVYENEQVLPRAFVVGQAEALPKPAEVLQTFKYLTFRQKVFLEGADDILSRYADASSKARERGVVLTRYQPHRVVLTVQEGSPGLLVLTDAWLPGWTCSVNGEKAEIYRANYLFRAVEVPAEASEVVFSFEPRSLRWGRWVSLGALGVALSILLGGLSRYVRKR